MENIENSFSLNQSYQNDESLLYRKTYEELERHKLLTKIEKLNHLINELDNMNEVNNTYNSYHPLSDITKSKRKRQKYQNDLVLSTLEELNEIEIRKIDSFLIPLTNDEDCGKYSSDFKRSIIEGCYYGFDFKIIKDDEIDNDRILNLNIEVNPPHTINISDFIAFINEEKNLPLFFCGIERVSRLIKKRFEIFEEIKNNFNGHIRLFNEDNEALYFFPIKNNRQFQLVFIWMISLRKDGAPLQTYELIPVMSKKCMLQYLNVHYELINLQLFYNSCRSR